MINIEKYFQGEKWQCTAGIIFSLVCIALSLYFLFLQNPVLKGIAFSIIPLSAILLIVCIAVVVKTPKDVARVNALYQSGSQMVQAGELPRMEKVMKTFSVLKTIELILFIVGLLLAGLFWSHQLARGIFIGLMFLSAMLYVFDYTASLRGKAYIDFLGAL